MIVGTHERPVKCPGCGQGFVFAIAEGQALWGVSVVSDVELNQLEPSLIKLVRPGGH